MIHNYRPLLFWNTLPAFLLWLVCFHANAQLESGVVKTPRSDYIVVYKGKMPTLQGKNYDGRQNLMRNQATATLAKHGLSGKTVRHVYDAVLNGFSVENLSGAELEKLRKDQQVDYVAPDRMVSLSVEPPITAAVQIAASCSGPVITTTTTVTDGSTTTSASLTNYSVQNASFGGTATVTGQVVLVNDGTGSTATLACSTIPTSLAGKIALIDRGICNFSAKAYIAQQAGAIGVIIANNVAGDAPGMTTGTNGNLVTIPVMSVTLSSGNQIKTSLSLANATVTATLDHGFLDGSSQCKPWGISRVAGGLPAPAGRRAWIIDSGIDLDHPDLNVNTASIPIFSSNEHQCG